MVHPIFPRPVTLATPGLPPRPLRPGSVAVRHRAAGGGAGGRCWGSGGGCSRAGTGAADATAGGLRGRWRHWTLGKPWGREVGWFLFGICIEDWSDSGSFLGFRALISISDYVFVEILQHKLILWSKTEDVSCLSERSGSMENQWEF